MIVSKAVAGPIWVFCASAAPPAGGQWRMQYQLPRVRSMRYLLGMTETVGPMLPVVIDGEDVRCWRLCGLQGRSL